MDKPLCPLCKTKHYAREAHVFRKSEPQAETAGNSGLGVQRPERGIPERPAGFDRLAYQRDYMRFWRAKKAQRVSQWPK